MTDEIKRAAEVIRQFLQDPINKSILNNIAIEIRRRMEGVC